MSKSKWSLSVAIVVLIALITIVGGVLAGVLAAVLNAVVVLWSWKVDASVRLPGTYKVEHKVCGDMGVGDSVYRRIPGVAVGGLVRSIMRRPDFEWVRVSREPGR